MPALRCIRRPPPPTGCLPAAAGKQSLAELVSREDGERERSATNTHKEQKTEQVSVTDKQRHGSYQFGVTAADSAAPEKQKRSDEDSGSSRKSITSRDRVVDEDYPKQAKYRDG